MCSRGDLASSHGPFKRAFPRPHFSRLTTSFTIRLKMYPRLGRAAGNVCLRCQWRLLAQRSSSCSTQNIRGLSTVKVPQTQRRALHAAANVSNTYVRYDNQRLTTVSAHTNPPSPPPLLRPPQIRLSLLAPKEFQSVSISSGGNINLVDRQKKFLRHSRITPHAIIRRTDYQSCRPLSRPTRMQKRASGMWRRKMRQKRSLLSAFS